jgi:hypothetical protein
MRRKTELSSIENQINANLNGEKICPKCGEIHQNDCQNEKGIIHDRVGNNFIYNKKTRKLDLKDEVMLFNFWNTYTGFHFHTGSSVTSFELVFNRMCAELVFEKWEDDDIDEIFFSLFATEFLVTKEELFKLDNGEEGVFEFYQMFNEHLCAYFFVKKKD